jgi:hypothetical protein
MTGTKCFPKIAFCPFVILVAIFSFAPLANAQTNGVDIDAAIAAYAQNVAWSEKCAIFGTSETTSVDTSTKSHREAKYDFKRYRDGDKIESREQVIQSGVFVQSNSGTKQTFTFSDSSEERWMAIPGMAFILTKYTGQSTTMRPPPTYLELARKDQMIANVLFNLKFGDSYGVFLEGNVSDFRLRSVGLPGAFKAARAHVTARQETYQDHECCVLDFAKDADHYAAWLVPDMDYTCIRYDLLHEKLDHIVVSRGASLKSIETVGEMSDVRQIEGKWIAMSGRLDGTSKFADGTWSKEITSVHRQKVLLNPDFDQLGAFRTDDIPDGARVSFWGEQMAGGAQFEWRHGAVVPQIDDASVRKECPGLTDRSG